MEKPTVPVLKTAFDHYIQLAGDGNIVQGLETNRDLFDARLDEIIKIADWRYAPDKWTPKELLQHIIDNERVQSYRALRIARNDKTELPGYDENLFAANTRTDSVTFQDLLTEFKLLRESNIMMYKGFSDEMMMRSGICSGIEITSLALGFVLIGHVVHHYKVLEERYLNTYATI